MTSLCSPHLSCALLLSRPRSCSSPRGLAVFPQGLIAHALLWLLFLHPLTSISQAACGSQCKFPRENLIGSARHILAPPTYWLSLGQVIPLGQSALRDAA